MEVLPALGAPARAARGAEASTSPEAEPQWHEGPESLEEWEAQGHPGECSEPWSAVRSRTEVAMPAFEVTSVKGRDSWSLTVRSPRS